jgi:hypothetical protein
MSEYERHISNKSGSLPPVRFFDEDSEKESGQNTNTLVSKASSMQSDLEKLASLDDQPRNEYNLPQSESRDGKDGKSLFDYGLINICSIDY